MPKILSALIIIVIALSPACSNTESDVITLNDDGVPVIFIEKITETGEMRFTDLITDFEIIRLETSEECLIDYIARSYVSDKYIIISTVWNGILLFSRDGSFVRTIALHGNGPGEVSDSNRNIELDDLNNKLYVTNQMSLTPELLCLNIENDGYENIPLATNNRLRNMYVSNDSILTVSTMPIISDASDNPVYAQTTSGGLLWKIKHTNRNGATNGELTRVGDQLYFNYIWGDDTLFTLANGKLIPHTIFYSDRHNYLPHIQESPGDINSGFRVLNDELISGSYSILTGFGKQNNSNRERPEFESGKRFIYNMKKKEAFIIDRIEDDILGSDKGFSQPQKNGIFAIHFTPVEILKLAEKIKNDLDVSDEVSERLLELSSRINEDDNPVMLIGKMK